MELARFLPRKDYTREYETLSYPRVELLVLNNELLPDIILFNSTFSIDVNIFKLQLSKLN